MRAKILLLSCSILLLLPATQAHAALDPACPGTFQSVSGTITELGTNNHLAGIRVSLLAAVSNALSGSPPSVTTDATGFYRLCLASFTNGLVYQVQAVDTVGRHETEAHQFEVLNNITTVQTVDFVLPYRLFLTLTPNAVTNVTSTSMTMTVRTAAPVSGPPTTVTATSAVLGTFTLAHVSDDAPPSVYHVYQTIVSIPPTLVESAPKDPYFVSAQGSAGSAVITTTDKQPFVVDRTDPAIGGNGCGPGGAFRLFNSDPNHPVTQTTNPQPVLQIGVCDGNSGVDLDSIQLSVDGVGPKFVTVSGTAAFYNVYFQPTGPLSLGAHSFVYSIKDLAGNPQTSAPLTVTIVNYGGSPPVINRPTPSPSRVANIAGPSFGFGANSSYPTITCYVVDGDGQLDLVPGSLSVRMYYQGVEKAHYNPNEPPTADPTSVADPNMGSWMQNTGLFNFNYNYLAQGALPGVYTVVAAVSDHGGNSFTLTWDFTLAFGI